MIMRAVLAALVANSLPGVAVHLGLPWQVACLMAVSGLIATTTPVVLREWFLHLEVMATVAKAGDQNTLNVTEAIASLRSTPTPRRRRPNRRARRQA